MKKLESMIKNFFDKPIFNHTALFMGTISSYWIEKFFDKFGRFTGIYQGSLPDKNPYREHYLDFLVKVW